ncbi:hypothetical protein V6N11_019096 [Hibiscus sabdariffa]|uniref:RNase H type-1 domain-containing protein n=1 Tax=Hibiscus sabdariffa TaxID=183260 RepID=A0ABR2R1F7_9ROSI
MDGIVSSSTGIGPVGGIFRADDGSWILDFNKTINIMHPLQTKLWGIFVGLQIAWDNRFERLLIQSDNKEAINRLNGANASFDSYSLIRAIAK